MRKEGLHPAIFLSEKIGVTTSWTQQGGSSFRKVAPESSGNTKKIYDDTRETAIRQPPRKGASEKPDGTNVPDKQNSTQPVLPSLGFDISRLATR
jgi:hypothetical protein